MATEDASAIVTASALSAFCAAALTKLGVPENDAALVADSLVQADLWGIETHGVSRLASYVKRIRTGGMKTRTQIAVLRDHGPILLLDGQDGIGQVVATHAMRLAIDRAEPHGIACVAVRRSNHVGALAYYSRMGLADDLISFATSGTESLMAPWGGISRILGSGPWSIAIPAGDERPIVVDFANNTMNGMKVKWMAERGERLPTGFALNERGEPTDDPAEALRGVILPIGGHKGYGILLALEVLASILTGAEYSTCIPRTSEISKPQRLGHLMLVLRVDRFMPVLEFKTKVDDLIQKLRSSRTAPGVERIFLPGEKEELLARERQLLGIPLSSATVESLRAVAASVSIPACC